MLTPNLTTDAEHIALTLAVLLVSACIIAVLEFLDYRRRRRGEPSRIVPPDRPERT